MMRCGFGPAPEEYKNDPTILSVSPSAIMEFLKSPAHYHAKYIRGKKKQTKVMKQGNMVHMAVLEPERFLTHYCREPNRSDFKNSMATVEEWKAMASLLGLKGLSGLKKEELKARVIQANPAAMELDWDLITAKATNGKEIISETDWLHIEGLKESLDYHPKLKAMFARAGWREQMAWVYDEQAKILYKFKTDFVDETGVIVDVKKAPSGEANDFSRKIFYENLYVQGAMYFALWTLLADHLTPTEDQMKIPRPRAFVFAVFEMESPYIWQPYNLDPGALDAGEQRYIKAIQRMLECREKNSWPGYSTKIEPISLPHYAWDVLDRQAEKELDDGTTN